MAESLASQTDRTARRSRRRSDADSSRPQLLGAILDGAPDPVVAIDCERRLRYANPACLALFGTDPASVLGRHVSELTQTHQPESEAPGGVRRGHVEIRLPSGEIGWFAYTASRVEHSDSVGGIAVVFLRDDTERRRDELRLSRHNDELEQTIRALAHDLRSPLVSVLGFSRLLREEFGESLGERGVHFVERVHAAGRSMEALIRDLLEFARIGHDGEAPALVDPREVLLQLRSELKPRLEQSCAELVLPDHPPLVRCARTRLYQLFSNLLGNALDHMGPVEKPRIDVEIRECAERHEIVVRDNGCGVPPEQRERIFEIFHSVQRPGGRKGTGLGLAIVRKIAESQGGRVFVDGAAGAGAAFHVVLPR